MLKALDKMCADPQFDRELARSYAMQIDVDQVYTVSISETLSVPTVLMEQAIDHHNLPMVELLLECGADPNLIYDFCGDESEFWNLQYPGDDAPEDDELRLQIARRMLDYGANPNITVEDDPVDLFTYVTMALFNDDDPPDFWRYRSRFFILLVAYGGKSGYCMPQIVGEFDKSNMQQYRFYLVPEANGKYSGVIVDGKNEEIAYI